MEHNNHERSGFQQDYALLMGAIALFLALAIVMVRNAQSGLVRARRELRLRERFAMARRRRQLATGLFRPAGGHARGMRSPDGADEKKIKPRNLRNPPLKYFHGPDEHRRGEGLV
jgi:hypothetical protein